ncbi:DUF2268 domain-containing putative Zn-dependent protease [Acinetobacter guerrae]|uniref:DUF2268 domain-containing putative Zn-dependent protease n=1 Tax=Acinetobacter guerrae TaxID=1843371 RepID=UPI00125F77B2|nr:DUF2268 domain-containing putative Zn-dependent protease [Acinetobacter guerrae]
MTIQIKFISQPEYEFNDIEQQLLSEICRESYEQVAHLLGSINHKVTVNITHSPNVIEETGCAGFSWSANQIIWNIDTNRTEHVIDIAKRHLKPTLYHELNHLFRGWVMQGATIDSFMDGVIHEGIAVCFERDYASSHPLWGIYPENVNEWVDELLNLTIDTHPTEWYFEHSDGRRWIAYKTGTYLVDRAMQNGKINACEISKLNTSDVLSLAGYSIKVQD